MTAESLRILLTYAQEVVSVRESNDQEIAPRKANKRAQERAEYRPTI